jgi:hypothetical protein
VVLTFGFLSAAGGLTFNFETGGTAKPCPKQPVASLSNHAEGLFGRVFIVAKKQKRPAHVLRHSKAKMKATR